MSHLFEVLVQSLVKNKMGFVSLKDTLQSLPVHHSSYTLAAIYVLTQDLLLLQINEWIR